jgi:hypothetical protein
MRYSLGLLPGHHDPTTQGYPIASRPSPGRKLPLGEAVGPTNQPESLAMPPPAKKANARSATPTEAVSHLAEVTDRMHGLLMDRADALMGCTENSR